MGFDASDGNAFGVNIGYADKRGNINSIQRYGYTKRGGCYESEMIDDISLSYSSGTNRMSTAIDAIGNDDCPDIEYVPVAVEPGIYGTEINLNSDGTPDPDKSIDFRSEGEVELNAGFAYASDGTGDFTAQVEDCPTIPANNELTLDDNELGFIGSSTTNYQYDKNGNLEDDPNKGIHIDYNYLNLPYLVTKGSDQIEWIYAADGTKLRKFTSEAGATDVTDYFGEIEKYSTGYAVYHEDGRVYNDGSVDKWQYKIADHLGNTRIMYSDDDSDGLLEIVQSNNYYPFGMSMPGEWSQLPEAEHNYLYNGKELSKDLGLGWYDYGARFYDAGIGRFPSIDPKAEQYSFQTPYAYAANDPIKFIDENGENPILGFVVGAGLDVASQMIFEGKSLGEVNIGSALISGVAGMASGGLSSVKNFGKGAQVAVGAAIDAGESVGKQVASGDEISLTQTASDMVMSNVGGKAKIFDDANIKLKENKLDRAQRVSNGDPASAGRMEKLQDAKGDLKFAQTANTAAGTATGNTLQTASDEVRSATQLNKSKFRSGFSSQRHTAQDNTRVALPTFELKSN